jgi:hypothetical protein
MAKRRRGENLGVGGEERGFFGLSSVHSPL